MAAVPPPATPVAPQTAQPPRISARATPPPPRTAPPPQKNAKGWWIVPAVVVGLVVIAWLLLAGLPFGGEEKNRPVATQRPSDVIAEGGPASAPAETGTILELPGDTPMATTVTNAPPNLGDQTATMVLGQPGTPATVPPPATAPAPVPAQPPVVATRPVPPPTQTATRQPVQRPAPPPARTEPRRDEPMYSNQREDPAPAMRVSEGEASSRLHSYARRHYDDVSASCLEVRSQGYVNEGYTMTVWNACDSRGGSRMLGRWRVDAKTGEIFRQNSNGKYVDP